VDAGRDVMTDLRPWQKQALGHVQQLAIQQGFRRRHPSKLLSDYNDQLFNGKNPRYKWEDAIRREDERIELPEVYKRAGDDRIANQLGLIETAHKNFMKSRARMQMCTPVGV
jgi:hypothetical protein